MLNSDLPRYIKKKNNNEMNLLRLEYSDEILKTLVVVVCLFFGYFHYKDISIDFRLVDFLYLQCGEV